MVAHLAASQTEKLDAMRRGIKVYCQMRSCIKCDLLREKAVAAEKCQGIKEYTVPVSSMCWSDFIVQMPAVELRVG